MEVSIPHSINKILPYAYNSFRFHRSMTRPFFTRERISDFDIYDRNASHSLSLAKGRLAEGYAIDLQDLVSRFTLDSATEFLFGSNVGSLKAGLPYPPDASLSDEVKAAFYSNPSNKFVAAFGEGQSQSSLRTGLGYEWPLGEFWKDSIKEKREIIDEFIAPVLQDAIKSSRIKPKAGSKAENEGQSLLDHLIGHTQGLSALLPPTLYIQLTISDLAISDADILKDEVCLFHPTLIMIFEHLHC